MMIALLLWSHSLYRVCWTGPMTRLDYCGAPMNKSLAASIARAENWQWPELRHWIEKSKKGDDRKVIVRDSNPDDSRRGERLK